MRWGYQQFLLAVPFLDHRLGLVYFFFEQLFLFLDPERRLELFLLHAADRLGDPVFVGLFCVDHGIPQLHLALFLLPPGLLQLGLVFLRELSDALAGLVVHGLAAHGREVQGVLFVLLGLPQSSARALLLLLLFVFVGVQDFVQLFDLLYGGLWGRSGPRRLRQGRRLLFGLLRLVQRRLDWVTRGYSGSCLGASASLGLASRAFCFPSGCPGSRGSPARPASASCLPAPPRGSARAPAASLPGNSRCRLPGLARSWPCRLSLRPAGSSLLSAGRPRVCWVKKRYLADIDLFIGFSDAFMRCGFTMPDSLFWVIDADGLKALSWLSCFFSVSRATDRAARSFFCTDLPRPSGFLAESLFLEDSLLLSPLWLLFTSNLGVSARRSIMSTPSWWCFGLASVRNNSLGTPGFELLNDIK